MARVTVPPVPSRRLVAFIVAGPVVTRASVDPGLRDVRLIGKLRAAGLLCQAVLDARKARQDITEEKEAP